MIPRRIQMHRRPFAPEYAFANPCGPWVETFAWIPRRMWHGRWVWLRPAWRQAMVVHEHLTPGGGDVFWRWTDMSTEGKEG
jgi:hypothetical protein